MTRVGPITSLVFSVVALAMTWTSTACDRPVAGPASRRSAKSYDADYLSALAAANQFCQAWRERDVDTAKALLSDRIRRTFSNQRIADALSGPSNPRHAAYEVSDGNRGPRGTIAFRLRLFYRYAGQAQDRIEAPVTSIVLYRDESGAWLVDRFPLLTEPDSPEVIVR